MAIALAVAAAVAGMIAAHNRRDTNAIILRALQEETRVNSLQLLSIQAGLATALQGLSELPNTVREIVLDNETLVQQLRVRSILDAYDEQRSSLPSFGYDLDAWLGGQGRTGDLTALLQQLTVERNLLWNLSAERDPTTPLIICSTALAELQMMNLLGRDPRDCDAIALRYTELLQRSKNPDAGHSVAWYVNRNDRLRRKALDDLEENALGKKLPVITDQRDAAEPSFVADGWVAAACKALQSYTQTNYRGGFSESPKYRLIYPAYIREIHSTVIAEVRDEIDPLEAQSFGQVEPPEIVFRVLEVDRSRPVDERPRNRDFSVELCRLEVRRDAIRGRNVRDVLKSEPEFQRGERNITQVEAILDDYNLAVAQRVFGGEVLKAVDATLAAVGRLRSTYTM